MEQTTPWLTVLVQALIEPQASCAQLAFDFPHSTFIPEGFGTWWIEVLYHRIAVTFHISEPQPDLDALLNMLRDAGLHLASVLLQAQALYSSQVLKLSGYTVTYQTRSQPMQPLWVELVPIPKREPSIVQRESLEQAAQIVAAPAFFSGHDKLRRALRNYETALEYEGKDRLIYLWQALEEVLWAYYQPKKPGEKLPKSPRYADATTPLDLTQTWLEELGTLCHEYARHSEARPKEHTLPATLDACTEAARARVVTIIERYALNLGGRHGQWQPLTNDILTGWRTP